jgi:AraC-like DNA-binding protein
MSTVLAPSHACQPRAPHLAFDSDACGRPADAVESWRNNLARSWDMTLPDKEDAARFSARVRMWKMDRTLIGHCDFGPVQTRARRERNIRADQLDHYRLLLVRHGRFDCDADGRQANLSAGRFVITDMMRPEFSVSACRTVVMYIPRDQLEQALPRPIDLHGISPGNACASLLAEHLEALNKSMPHAAPEELPGLAQATVNLVAASLASSEANVEGARPAVECVLLRRGRRFVDQHLADEDLAAPLLCTHLQVSRSTLYRVFEPIGGVSQFIRERRLAKVHEILSRSGERPQIARLAEAHGFKCAAHFSKAFREQYGYSAREVPRYRSAALDAGNGSARLNDWLGALVH